MIRRTRNRTGEIKFYTGGTPINAKGKISSIQSLIPIGTSLAKNILKVLNQNSQKWTL